MPPKQLIDIVNEGSALAVRLGHREAGVAHLVMAAMDMDGAKAWLRARNLAYYDVRHEMLEHLDGMEAGDPGVAFALSDLSLKALQAAIAGDPDAGAAQFIAAVWNLPDDGSRDWQAVHRLKSMRRRGGVAAGQPSALGKWCVEMVGEAARGSYDPVVGREDVIERAEQILSRRKKNNPILLGEAGVGKTSIVEAIATRIADGETMASLRGCRIHSLDVVGLVSGTRDRGDLEARIKSLMDSLASDSEAILFVDEIHVLSGGVSGAADVANLIKPALSSGRIRCIGATTHAEFARYVETDPAFARRFQPLAVAEPSADEAVSILNRVAPSYAGHHGVVYEKDAIRAAVDMSVRFVVGRHLPDKAIDLLDECGSIAAAQPGRRVTRDTVATAISRMSGLGFVRDPDLAKKLSGRVKGQDGACAAIAEAVTRSVSDVGPGSGTRCLMLFHGPERSGKRHAAVTLAETLAVPLHVIDMSEFSEAHSVSGLFGPPPGYVGFGMGGRLTEPVRRSPACVLVLERIDRAHPAVMASVMAALESGTASDSAGRRASFAAATVVMTSVPDESGGGGIGFMQRDGGAATVGLPGVADLCDAVVRFDGLDREALKAVAEARLSAFLDHLRAGGYRVDMDAGVAETVALEAEKSGGGAAAVERAFRKVADEAVANASDMTVRIPSGKGGLER